MLENLKTSSVQELSHDLIGKPSNVLDSYIEYYKRINNMTIVLKLLAVQRAINTYKEEKS